MIELDDVRLRVQLAQECLRGFAVGAPGFAEDGWESVSFRLSSLHYLLVLDFGYSRGDDGWGNIPTAFSSIMLWALVFAADMAAGLTDEP